VQETAVEGFFRGCWHDGGDIMQDNTLKKLIMNGLMIALVFLATYFTRIPTMVLPGGYFNLGDAVIILASVLLGPAGGLAAGAVGSALADIAAAALLFAPITFVVKGLEGLAVGLLTSKIRKSGALKQGRLIISTVAGAAVMIVGYFLAEAFLLGMFDEAFGLTAAVAELLPNTLQGIFSAVLGYILVLVFSKINLDRPAGR